MKKLLAILLAALLVAGMLAGCGGSGSGEDNSLQYIKDKGTLILGLDDAFPPMGFTDENGEIVGVDIDVLKAVACLLYTSRPCTLNGNGQRALVTGTGAGHTAGNNLSALGKESLQSRNVLVIDGLDFVGAESTHFLAGTAAARASLSIASLHDGKRLLFSV